MPKLSYPGGRQAAARVPEPQEDLKSSSIKKVDVVGDEPIDGEEQTTDVLAAPEDDASIAFKKQIEALKESERIQKERAEQFQREREDAIKRANEREAEIHSLKKTNVESQVDYMSAALAAATAEAEAAQGAIEKALELGDFKGQAEAYRRLSKAETNIAQLEAGKAELESQAKVAAEAKVAPPQDRYGHLHPKARSWALAHPEIMNNDEQVSYVNASHWKALKRGYEVNSDDYFDFIETEIGLKPSRTNREQEIEEPQERTRNVSAPVSRDNPPSSSGDRPGRVTLTASQREAAKIAGITDKEYAEYLLKLREHKANGHYGGGQ